jgi:hypothetical protein
MIKDLFKMLFITTLYILMENQESNFSKSKAMIKIYVFKHHMVNMNDFSNNFHHITLNAWKK